MAGAGMVGGCNASQKPVRLPTVETDPDARFLSRAGFGPKPGDIDELRTKGREAWLEEQLAPTSKEPMALKFQLSILAINNFKAFELRDWPKAEIVRQSQQSDVLNAVMSPWQVRERMVDFWTNHFNIYANKSLAAYRIPTDQREVVRKHVLGSFPEMLMASAKSTAMLLYLDQQASTWVVPNENYARELLELHSLGVEEGAYTQQDVMAVARCFTGWTENRSIWWGTGDFRFDPKLHDAGEKTVLGHRIERNRGIEDGEEVVTIVARHPSTARHIARKLCRFFLGDDGANVESAVADAYLQEPVGDIPRMLRVLLLSDELLTGAPTLKRPFDYVISALRALDASTDGKAPVLRHLSDMGQPTHMWPMPDGYPMEPEAWNGSMLGRWNFAIELASNRIGGTKIDIPSLLERYGANDRTEWVSAVFGTSSGTERLDGFMDAISDGHTEKRPANDREWQELTALCLCSPEFQWR